MRTYEVSQARQASAPFLHFQFSAIFPLAEAMLLIKYKRNLQGLNNRKTEGIPP